MVGRSDASSSESVSRGGKRERERERQADDCLFLVNKSRLGEGYCPPYSTVFLVVSMKTASQKTANTA